MKRQWTDTHTEMLRDLYPVETIERTAEIIGFCPTTIKVKARKYGIVKGMSVEWLDKAAIVRNHFDTHSFAEIGKKIGATKTTVARIARKLGLKRTRQDNKVVRSRVRKDIVKREKRRVIFGFDPITRIKVVTNRRRIRLRAELKAAGYIVERMANILYFKSEDCRNLNKENIASRHGLSFAPWPYEESLVNAI